MARCEHQPVEPSSNKTEYRSISGMYLILILVIFQPPGYCYIQHTQTQDNIFHNTPHRLALDDTCHRKPVRIVSIAFSYTKYSTRKDQMQVKNEKI